MSTVLERAMVQVAAKDGVAIDMETDTEERKTRLNHIWVQCSSGHAWEPSIYNLANGHWCPHCAKNAPRNIGQMQELAASRSGQCLSAVYSTGDLTWKCAFDHTWTATANNVSKHKSWCPKCHINIGEELTRATFQEVFPEHNFERTQAVPWMEKLELDGYNEELQLAFEYQGVQHYKRVDYFQQTEEDFKSQQARDARKRQLCEANGCTLLEIPYTIKHGDVRAHVRSLLAALPQPRPIAESTESDIEFYNRVRVKNSGNTKQFKRATDIIAKKGGTCRSTTYLGYRGPLLVTCGKGHQFETTLESIDQAPSRGPRFCPDCGGTKRQTDDVIQALVSPFGYTLTEMVSRTGKDGRSRRFFTGTCPYKHPVDMSWDNMKPGPTGLKEGCSTCSKQNKGSHLRQNGEQWGVDHNLTLIDIYGNENTKYHWICNDDHEFTAKLKTMKDRTAKGGIACPHCDLVVFGIKHDLTLVTPWTDTTGPTDKLHWICNKCDTVVVLSKNTMGRRNVMCERCVDV